MASLQPQVAPLQPLPQLPPPSMPLPSPPGQRTGIFGKPLGHAVPQGAEMPDVVDHSLQVLAYCVPSEKSLFEMPVTDPEVTALRQKFEFYDSNSGQESPISSVENPQIIVALLKLYFMCLPHPVVPPKYYHTFLRVAQCRHPQLRLSQFRILVHKLPNVSKAIVLGICNFLHAAKLPADFLAGMFASYLFRESTAHLPQGVPPPKEVLTVVCDLISQAPYIGFTAQSPSFNAEDLALCQVLPPADSYLIQATTQYTFAGGQNMLAFAQGEGFVLDEAYPNNWFAARRLTNGESGFLPGQYVEIVLVQPPRSLVPPAAAPAPVQTIAGSPAQVTTASQPMARALPQPQQPNMVQGQPAVQMTPQPQADRKSVV